MYTYVHAEKLKARNTKPLDHLKAGASFPKGPGKPGFLDFLDRLHFQKCTPLQLNILRISFFVGVKGEVWGIFPGALWAKSLINIIDIDPKYSCSHLKGNMWYLPIQPHTPSCEQFRFPRIEKKKFPVLLILGKYESSSNHSGQWKL